MASDEKTIIYCFSATGNSLKLARDISAEMGNCDIERIKENAPEERIITAFKRIGFVFPVHAYGLPIIVRKFVKNLPIKGSPYIFAAVTCAGRPAGALSQLRKMLSRKGKVISAGFIINMPGSYLPLHRLQQQNVIDRMFKVEESNVKSIVEKIKKSEDYGLETGKYYLNKMLSDFIYWWFCLYHNVFDVFFWLDEKCDSCGLCSKVCPVNNITMINGKPKWNKRCIQCMACLQWCPRDAIQFLNSTKGKRRYINPYIKPEEIILQ